MIESDGTLETTRKIFSEMSFEEIDRDYSKAELTEMFKGVYGRPPMARWRKQDIINTIRNYFRGIERARRLKP